MRKIRVAVDCMTTELGPEAAVFGAIDALKEIETVTDDLELSLVGDLGIVKNLKHKTGYTGNNVILVSSRGIIAMDDVSVRSWIDPKHADTSLRKCVDLVASGDADGFLSAGNSAASGTVAKKYLGLVSGIRTTPIVCRVPTDYPDKFVLMGDVGLQVNYTAQYMVECAVMQAVYLRTTNPANNPRIGILNIGEEKYKGNQHMKKAFPSLEKISETGFFEFVGNKEPKHIISGEVDGVVCGADIGNMYIKAGAAVAKMLMRDLKDCSLIELPLFVMALPYLAIYKYGRGKRFNPSTYCGAPILGPKKIGVITHGASDRESMKQSTLRTREVILLDYPSKLESALMHYRPFEALSPKA